MKLHFSDLREGQKNEAQAIPRVMTAAQKNALKWFRRHNGDGVFDRYNVLVAAGERAPICRSTWNRLEQLGFVEFYGGHNGRRRLRLREAVP